MISVHSFKSDVYASLDWDDVAEGQSLPTIHYELNLLRMVAFVRASGLLDYIHFDREYAQSVGMRDAFMATPHIIGLVSRLLTDWAGPAGDIRSISLDLVAPCCSGDILIVTGKVGRKYRNSNGAHLVELVDIAIAHDHAPIAVRGSALMELPFAGKRTARQASIDILPSLAGEDVPSAFRSMIGSSRPGPHRGVTGLTEHEILLWCECLEDWNPLYWDHGFAAGERYGGIVAPPGQSWFFGAGMGVSAGIGWAKPGVSIPPPIRQGMTGLPLRQALREVMMEENAPFTLPDYPEAVVRTVNDEYFAPLRPGEALSDVLELADCSPLKRTRLGEGHFITFNHDFRNARKELVRRLTLSLFHFRP